MKVAVWITFALLALVWTGGAAMLSWLVEVAAGGLSAGGGASLPAPGEWAMPPWLAAWIDPAWWQALLQSVTQAWSAIAGWAPALSTAVGWLEPAIWVAWGLGLAALLLVAGLATWLVGRFAPGRHAATGASA